MNAAENERATLVLCRDREWPPCCDYAAPMCERLSRREQFCGVDESLDRKRLHGTVIGVELVQWLGNYKRDVRRFHLRQLLLSDPLLKRQ